MRKWGDQNPTENDMAALDFSTYDAGASAPQAHASGLVDAGSMGVRGKDGTYEIQDWEFQSGADEAIAQALDQGASKGAKSTSAFSSVSSLFARFTGGKILTEEDLRPVLSAMEEHLMKKNVAKTIADKVCDGVGKSMTGKKITGYQCKLPTLPSRFHSSPASCDVRGQGSLVSFHCPNINSQNLHGHPTIH
jgi:signal recognition particle receptor subunit alpha